MLKKIVKGILEEKERIVVATEEEYELINCYLNDDNIDFVRAIYLKG